MNQYVTGAMIRRLREEKKITQQQMADAIGVSDKAISKWETGRGYPDITLIEPIAAALGVSVIELFAGADVVRNAMAEKGIVFATERGGGSYWDVKIGK